MTYFVVATVVAIVLFLASLAAFHRSDWNSGTVGSVFLFGLAVLFGLAALIMGCFVAVTLGGRAVGRTTCRNWERQTGYVTKFEVLNWADGGTCLAKAPDGRWVVNTQVIVNVPARTTP